MDCFECGAKSAMKQEKIIHKYKECGLDNVILEGVTRSHCTKCGEQTFNFGNIEQLHNLIAMTLVKKSDLLSGKEVRFLRKCLGYNSAMFAKLLSKTPETISHIENGENMNAPFDRLVRFAVLTKQPDRHYDFHDQVLNGLGTKIESIKLHQRNNHWEMLPNAA